MGKKKKKKRLLEYLNFENDGSNHASSVERYTESEAKVTDGICF